MLRTDTPTLTFAWTPPHCTNGVGAIALRAAPSEPLTPAAYRWALAGRIDRMVEREQCEDARRLLEIAEDRESLIIGHMLATAGEILVEHSDVLASLTNAPAVAVPLADLIHEPEMLDAMRDERLEDYLAALYG